MTFNIAGFGLFILTLAVIAVQIVSHRWVKKVTNMYWFWLGLACAYIIYCICTTWINHWQLFAHLELPISEYADSPGQQASACAAISNAFLFNICPFVNFVLPICLIADPSRKAARSLAPIAIIASFMVVFMDIPWSSSTEFTLRYIFVGKPGGIDLYYFGHAMNMFMSIGVILNTPKFGWKGLVSSYGALAIFYLYVAIGSAITGCIFHVSGLNINDFGKNGTYHIFYDVGLNPTLSISLFFPGLLALIFGEIVLIDTIKRGWFKYGEKYSGCWWHWYDYNKTLNKEPWGYFSHQWQLNHKHRR